MIIILSFDIVPFPYVGIHWITLTEYSQLSTHVPEFQAFFKSFFCRIRVLKNISWLINHF